MKFKHILTTGLLAVAGTLVASSAHAATVQSNSDDLFLGFRETTNTTSDYLIDLGPAYNFRTDGTTIGQLSLGNVGADLTSLFGANWYNDPNLFWSVIGTPGSASITPPGSQSGTKDFANLLYSSAPESTYGTMGSAPTADTASTQGTPRSEIVTMQGAYNGSTSTSHSSVAITQTPSLTAGSTDYAYFASKTFDDGIDLGQIEQSFANGATKNALDLFRTPSTNSSGVTGTYQGTFTIDNSGDISYSKTLPAAVPEPSTLAAIGVGAAVLGFARRRRISFKA